MHSRRAGAGQARTALVLISGSINYFYNLNGRRVAEALGELEFAVDVHTLATCPARDYGWCVLVNISEVALSVGDGSAGLARICTLGPRWRAAATCALDCAATPWFGAFTIARVFVSENFTTRPMSLSGCRRRSSGAVDRVLGQEAARKLADSLLEFWRSTWEDPRLQDHAL
jgi:hypothetical protein